MYILSVETSTKNCSVALSQEGKTILCVEVAQENYSHSEKLHVFIRDLIVSNGYSFSDLNAVAVSMGPGSYTGLRIGISAVKGLCYGLNIPMIAIDTLQILASAVPFTDGIIIPMIDARRMEVYCAIFDTSLNNISPTEAKIIDENSFSELTSKVYFVGDATSKCVEVLIKENFIFLPEIVYPSASNMGRLAYNKFKNQDFVDVAYFEPFYLKEFMIGK